MNKRIRRLHRIIGIALLMPMSGWAITGFVFYVKPGYSGAYEVLTPLTHPLDGYISITPEPDWLEFRYFRTAIGDHLIVRTAAGWVHLDPRSMRAREEPTEEEITRLLADAFTANPGRYGRVSAISEESVRTDTGVEIAMDWNRLSFAQRGQDTDRIDLLYRIHYLQWTGVGAVDRVLGLAGLLLVMVLTLLGGWLAFGGNRV